MASILEHLSRYCIACVRFVYDQPIKVAFTELGWLSWRISGRGHAIAGLWGYCFFLLLSMPCICLPMIFHATFPLLFEC